MTGRSPWLPFGSGGTAGVRLVCLPHAGAGASGYRAWGRALPPEVELCPVQLPGRETRLRERPYDRGEPLAAELAGVVAELVAPPYALFGHSLGALVAFQLARRLRALGAPPPVHLFVSGRHAPQVPSGLRELRELSLPALSAELAALGGTPAAVLADQDLLASIAPLLRADFAVNETYRHTDEPPLDTPITAFAAAADPRAVPTRMAPWAAHTTGGFALHRLPGGHFAVLEQAPLVHARLVAALAPWLPAPAAACL